MRPGLRFTIGWRGLALAVVCWAVLFFAIGALDYLFLGTAKDRSGILGWLFPSPSAYPDIPLDEIEARLSELMADQSYFVGTPRPRRLRIDGCLVTITLDSGRGYCGNENASFWKTETFFDLRLLVTDPRKVTVRPVAHPRSVDAASISIPVREEAGRRLRAMDRLFSQKRLDEIRRDTINGTYDLPARMDRFRAFVDERLTDRLFERLGERTFYCEAGVLLAPSGNWYRMYLHTNEAHAREVVELLHAYAVRACPFSDEALAVE